MDTLDTKNEPDIFVYEKCDYKCFKNSKYDRHLATDKHKWIHFGYILDTFWIHFGYKNRFQLGKGARAYLVTNCKYSGFQLGKRASAR